MELRNQTFVSPFLLFLSLFRNWPVPIWYQSHSLVIAPEIRSSGQFGGIKRCFNPRSAMDALPLSLLGTVSIIAMLCSPNLQNQSDALLIHAYTVRLSSIFSCLSFQELAMVAPPLFDSTSSFSSDSIGRNSDIAIDVNVFIRGVPEPFNNGMVVIHGVQGSVSLLSLFSCNERKMSSPSYTYRVIVLQHGGLPNDVVTHDDFLTTLNEDNGYDCTAQSFTSEDGVHNTRGRSNAINTGFYSRVDDDFFANFSISWNFNHVHQSYQWVEEAIGTVSQPQLDSWQSAVCDVLLEVGIDSYDDFSSDHSIGTKIGGSTFDSSGGRHSSVDLLSYAKDSIINVAVHVNVEGVHRASSPSSFATPSEALTLPSSYLEYIGNQLLRELDSKLISAFIVQQSSKHLPLVVKSWPLVGGLFRFSKGPNDSSDSLKELNRLKKKGAPNFQLAHGQDSQLSAKQREAIYTTRVFLLLHANKLDQARELVFGLPEMFSDSVKPILLQATLQGRENKAGKAKEILAQFADQFAEKSKVDAAVGHPHIATDALAKISDIQHKPATAATLVSLEERAGDIDGAAAMLDSAIKWWSASMTEDNKLDITMQETASFNSYVHKPVSRAVLEGKDIFLGGEY